MSSVNVMTTASIFLLFVTTIHRLPWRNVSVLSVYKNVSFQSWCHLQTKCYKHITAYLCHITNSAISFLSSFLLIHISLLYLRHPIGDASYVVDVFCCWWMFFLLVCKICITATIVRILELYFLFSFVRDWFLIWCYSLCCMAVSMWNCIRCY